jgi:hypothetical protein
MSETQGVRGELLEVLTRSNAQLLTRALNQHWPVPYDVRKRAVQGANGILKNARSSPREILAAHRVLLSASRLNLDVVRTTIKVHDHLVITAQVDELEERSRMHEEGHAATALPHASDRTHGRRSVAGAIPASGGSLPAELTQ